MKITELKNLVEGEIVEVKGNLMYAKYLTKRLDGEELAEQIKSDSKYSECPNENPRYTFQVFDAAVVKKGDKPTDAEIYVKSKVYESKDGTKILRAEKTAKSDKVYLLTGVRQADGKIKKVDLSGKSLENEQPITVQYQVQKYKKSNGKEAYAVALFAVIFESEPKLWTPSGSSLPDGWEDVAPAADADAEAPDETTTEEAPAADAAGDVWAD